MNRKKHISILLLIIMILGLSQTVMAQGDFNNVIEGYYLGREGNRALIRDYNGQLHKYDVSPYAELLIDTRPVKLTDFKSGMEIYAELRGRRIFFMDAFSADKPGHIVVEGKMRTGTVKMIDRTQLKIRNVLGEEETFFLTPATLITRQGKNVKATALTVGDNVKLYFSEMNSSIVERMEIEGISIEITDLYKGEISLVDDLMGKISFDNTEVFKNKDWEEAPLGLDLELNEDVPVYAGGQRIPSRNLKYYKGKTAYLAIKDDFGRDKVEKMVIKNDYETIYADRIDDVNRWASQIELANKKNIDISEGTMVIKNGRLVDTDSINRDSTAFVVADGRVGDLTANVLYIYDEDINNSNLGQDYIYAGRFDRIFQNRIELRDFHVLNRNEWESFGRTKDLYYDKDTYIYDEENGRELDPYEFFSKGLGTQGNKGDRRGWYAYLWTEGDRIVSIRTKKSIDSLLKQRVTAGIVEEELNQTNMGWGTKIKNGRDWSERSQKWVPLNASQHIYFKDTMIIKDGREITPDQLKVGDRLYMVRTETMAKIVLVK